MDSITTRMLRRRPRAGELELASMRRERSLKSSGFPVAVVGLLDGERSHHVVVLVLDDVAVVDVVLRLAGAGRQAELRAHDGELAGVGFHGVLPAHLLRGRWEQRAGDEASERVCRV